MPNCRPRGLENYDWPMLIAWGVGFPKTWQLPLKPLGESGGMQNFPEEGLIIRPCQAMQKTVAAMRDLETCLCLRNRGTNQGVFNHRIIELGLE